MFLTLWLRECVDGSGETQNPSLASFYTMNSGQKLSSAESLQFGRRPSYWAERKQEPMGKIRLYRQGCQGVAMQAVCAVQGHPVTSSVFTRNKRHFISPFKTMSFELVVGYKPGGYPETGYHKWKRENHKFEASLGYTFGGVEMAGLVVKREYCSCRGLSSVPNTHFEQLTAVYNYSSRGICHLWPLRVPTHTCTYPHTDNKHINEK